LASKTVQIHPQVLIWQVRQQLPIRIQHKVWLQQDIRLLQTVFWQQQTVRKEQKNSSNETNSSNFKTQIVRINEHFYQT